MTARRVLELAGAPDHVRRSAAGPPGPVEWRESWEYDSLRDGRWSTLRLTWRDHLNIGTPGTYQVYLGICFAGKDACLTGGAAWDRLSPSITVTVQ